MDGNFLYIFGSIVMYTNGCHYILHIHCVLQNVQRLKDMSLIASNQRHLKEIT